MKKKHKKITLAKVHNKELQDLRNEHNKLRNDIKDNLEQHNANIELTDSELKQSHSNIPKSQNAIMLNYSLKLPIIEIYKKKQNLQVKMMNL